MNLPVYFFENIRKDLLRYHVWRIELPLVERAFQQYGLRNSETTAAASISTQREGTVRPIESLTDLPASGFI
jgi:hypothetical protein